MTTFKDYVGKKQFFKFTGPPENWITAIKYMTWGLEEKHYDKWAKIMPGDIFLMHSTSTGSFVKGAQSSIIGVGIVGPGKTKKSSFLWLQEKVQKINKWSLLVPFSEIYLFTPFLLPDDLPDVEQANISEISKLAGIMLKNAIPLRSLSGFPQMGSFSRVKDSIVEDIYNRSGKFFVIDNLKESDDEYTSTPLIEMDTKSDVFRYATSLTALDEVKRRLINGNKILYEKNNKLLERAESSHQDLLEKLLFYYKDRGFHIYSNKHIDLLAVKEDKGYLFEVKSNENKNFLSQSRKGIVQLFEYEYFEVDKFVKDSGQAILNVKKNLSYTQEPRDEEYVKFINSLKVGVTYFQNNDLIWKGADNR